MSNFGAKLEELIEKNKLSAAEVSRASGIKEGLLSRWINNRQIYVDHADLERLTAVFKRPHHQAELIRAHLLDECVGQGSHLIDIQIAGATTEVHESTTPYRVVPPLKIQRALDVLARESITDFDVRNILLSMASLCRPSNSKNEAVDRAAAEIVSAGVDDIAGAAIAPPAPVPSPTTPARGRLDVCTPSATRSKSGSALEP